MVKKQSKRPTWVRNVYIGLGVVLFIISSGKVAYDKWNVNDALNVIDSVSNSQKVSKNYVALSELPDYDGKNQVVKIQNNQPNFTQADLSLTQDGWQTFAELDQLNRVGQANALLQKKMMPTSKRESIATVYPSGWKQKKISADDWLYNRSHLIGFQFTGENANPRNLLTGTKALNQDVMRLYEDEIAQYLRQTGHHVRYRVTPYFKGNELVARGVQMEAQSIEDQKIQLNIFIYNIQPGYVIDYTTGQSKKTSTH